MEVIKMVSPSDWIFIICTLILAIIALLGPYINELWKRKSLAPKLKIGFYKESSYINENSKKCVQQIEVNSSGIWREDREQILQEIKITLS
jgi:hypothetical protein